LTADAHFGACIRQLANWKRSCGCVVWHQSGCPLRTMVQCWSVTDRRFHFYQRTLSIQPHVTR